MDVAQKHTGAVLVTAPDALARELVPSLRAAGFVCESAAGGARARRALRELAYDVWICDAETADLDPLAELATLAVPPALIELAGFGSLEDAVEAVRGGAFDYLCQPYSSEQVALSVARAVEARALRAENHVLRAHLSQRFELGKLLTRDPAMHKLLELCGSVADTRATVLIEGESGTGKSLLARALHQRSNRASAPFVEVNCGALPDALLESELFGHAKGAFTGAVRERAGKFEAADSGTIFLDEIGTASLDLQVKLLRVLQERTFERVGDTRTRSCDVRVIAATNVDLQAEVRASRFREDLYWRVRVVAFRMPPLRERPGDVALLAEHFLARFASEYARPARALSSEALAALGAHAWPGNVRELEHALERAVLLCAGETLSASDLGPEFARADAGPSNAAPAALPSLRPGMTLKDALAEPEREIIRQALAACRGNRNETARMLDVNRTTLFNKMKKYKLMEFPLRAE